MLDRPVHLYKNFLGNIFSIAGILNNTDGGIKDPVLVSIYQVFECGFIIIAETLYQFLFIQPLPDLYFEDATYEIMLFINAKKQDSTDKSIRKFEKHKTIS